MKFWGSRRTQRDKKDKNYANFSLRSLGSDGDSPAMQIYLEKRSSAFNKRLGPTVWPDLTVMREILETLIRLK